MQLKSSVGDFKYIVRINPFLSNNFIGCFLTVWDVIRSRTMWLLKHDLINFLGQKLGISFVTFSRSLELVNNDGK